MQRKMSKLTFLLFMPGVLYCSAPSVTGYVAIDKIHPGQLRYSSKNVEQKVSDALKKGYAIKQGNKFILKFNNGTSALPAASALPVIKGPFENYVLADGHHDVISNIKLGATTVPIKVIDDLSHLSLTKFWQEAEKKGYVYLYDLSGKRKTPPEHFQHNGELTLKDDPERYFAAITARKCDSADTAADQSTGMEYPLWIKVGKELMIEFKISDKMRKHGLKYEYSMGDNPSRELINQVRDMLRQDPIPGLKLIPTETHYKDINKNNGGVCRIEAPTK